MAAGGRYSVPLFKLDKAYIHKRAENDAAAVKTLLWNTDFDGARELAAKTRSTDMFGDVRYAETLLWTYLMEESEEHRLAAENALREACEGCEEVRRESEEAGVISSFFYADELGALRPAIHAHALTLAGFAKLGQSFMEVKGRSFVTGAYHLRAALQLYEAAEEKAKALPADNGLQDSIKFGLGFFRLVASLVPEKFQWATQLIGFTADREGGVRRLREVHKNHGPYYTEAGAMVASMRFFLDEEVEEAKAMVLALLKERPRSVYLLNLLAGMYRFGGHIPEAVNTLHKAMELSKPHPQLRYAVGYTLSDLYFFVGDYEKAIPLQRAYFTKSLRKNFKAFCGWKLGFGMYMVKGEAAVKDIGRLYKKVIAHHIEDSESYDRFSKRKCEEFLRTMRISGVDAQLFPAIWMVEVHQCDLALARLGLAKDIMDSEPHTADQVALREYLVGACQVGKGNYDVGETHLRNALQVEVAQETWVGPYCYVSLAEAAYRKGKKQLAEEHIKRGRDGPSQFDFDGKQRMFLNKLAAKVAKM